MRNPVSVFRVVCLCIAGSLLLALGWPAAVAAEGSEEDRILGHWDDGSAIIEISKCEEKYCGTIVKLHKPEVDGKPRMDSKNEDKSLRSRSLVGVQMLTDYVYTGDNLWSEGMTYVTGKGKSYAATFTMAEEDKLEVRVKLGDAVNLFTWPRTTLD